MMTPRALFAITAAASFFVYVATLAPTITWRNDGLDSGDLATAVAVGGVPHPPGYPTYLVLGDLFKRLPFGDVAYRLNLLSAATMALAVAVLGLAVFDSLSKAAASAGEEVGEERRSRQRLIWLCPVSAALIVAFSGPIWSQAVITEVYALNSLFAATALYGALQVRPANQVWLVPALFAGLGLGLGNHPSLLLVLPLLIWPMQARWRWPLRVAAALALAAGLSIYLVIPLRAAAAPPLNWGLATTWPNFRWLVAADLYRPFLFALPWPYVPARLAVELRLLAQSFLVLGLPTGLLGWLHLVRCYRRLAYGSAAAFVLISLYAITYNTTDSYVYLLPGLLIFALWLGWGLYDLGRALQNRSRPGRSRGHLAIWGLVLLPLVPLWLNFPAQDLSQDGEALAFAHQSLQQVAPGAVIIADNDPQTFALWYGRYGLAQRPDVAIVNSHLLAYPWYRQSLRQTHPRLRLSDEAGQPLTALPAFIEHNLPVSPIYLASLGPPALADYRLEPGQALTRVVNPLQR
ncbi:MAG: DUF2723 domain-containing protein [Anaerolineae bacterium]